MTQDLDVQMKEAAEKYTIIPHMPEPAYLAQQHLRHIEREAYLTAAREWYRKGQEEMRERAKSVCDAEAVYAAKNSLPQRYSGCWDSGYKISNLPIEGDEK